MIAIFITIILIVVIVVERSSDKVDRFLSVWIYSRVADEAKMETIVFFPQVCNYYHNFLFLNII